VLPRTHLISKIRNQVNNFLLGFICLQQFFIIIFIFSSILQKLSGVLIWNTKLARDFFPLLRNVQIRHRAHPASYSINIGVPSWRWSDQGMKSTIILYLVPRLRTSGATPQLPLYSFMAWTGKTYLSWWWNSTISSYLLWQTILKVGGKNISGIMWILLFSGVTKTFANKVKSTQCHHPQTRSTLSVKHNKSLKCHTFI